MKPTEQPKEEKKQSSKKDLPKAPAAENPPVDAQGKKLTKREMDKILLTQETREIKEKLMEYVNEIIIRQNQVDPVSNFESFHTETSSRKVLKDLLGEFQLASDELKKK